jgi:hypothetical protein
LRVSEQRSQWWDGSSHAQYTTTATTATTALHGTTTTTMTTSTSSDYRRIPSSARSDP